MAFMEDMCINVREYGLPPWLKQSRICLLMQETWVQSLGQDDPLEKGMAMHSSIFEIIVIIKRSRQGVAHIY